MRTKTTRRAHQSSYEISSEYILPDHAAVPRRLRGATFRLRHDTTEQDDNARGFKLNENLRIIDPMDTDFDPLYGLRNNAENLNRRLEDTLWAGRARSVTIARQRVDHLGYALYNNLLARIAHERRAGTPAVPWLPSSAPQLAFVI